jgi:hypothetical protein
MYHHIRLKGGGRNPKRNPEMLEEELSDGTREIFGATNYATQRNLL